LRIRNHSTIPRSVIIQHIARCVPDGHTVSLENPKIFILVEVFKVRFINGHADNFNGVLTRSECLWYFSRSGLLSPSEIQRCGDRK
jgi:hypothetical protein